MIKIKEYGRVIGDVNIQKEIQTRGPVSCYINGQYVIPMYLSTFMYSYNMILLHLTDQIKCYCKLD